MLTRFCTVGHWNWWELDNKIRTSNCENARSKLLIRYSIIVIVSSYQAVLVLAGPCSSMYESHLSWYWRRENVFVHRFNDFGLEILANTGFEVGQHPGSSKLFASKGQFQSCFCDFVSWNTSLTLSADTHELKMKWEEQQGLRKSWEALYKEIWNKHSNTSSQFNHPQSFQYLKSWQSSAIIPTPEVKTIIRDMVETDVNQLLADCAGMVEQVWNIVGNVKRNKVKGKSLHSIRIH